MSESRRNREFSAALALLVLTGSTVTSISVKAEEAAQAQAPELAAKMEIQQAYDALSYVKPGSESPEETQMMIDRARTLLQQSLEEATVTARPPTCG